jgi:hypothetical protein
MKKFTAVLLVVSLLAINCTTIKPIRKEKKWPSKANMHGVELIIQKIDGTQVRGELIAVKENSLLLMDRYSGVDMSVAINHIRVVKILKKGKLLPSLGLGFITAGVTSKVLGDTMGNLEGAGYILLSTFIAGTVISYSLIGDKTIQIEGKSDSEIQEILSKLRKKARIRNYQ